MKFKKIIATASALTMALSAAAEFGVAANAEEVQGTLVAGASFDTDGVFDDIVIESDNNTVYAEVADGQMRIGRGSYSISIPESYQTASAENNDVVTMEFDLKLVGLSKRNAGYYITDSAGKTVVQFGASVYSSTYSKDTILGVESEGTSTAADERKLMSLKDFKGESKNDPGFDNPTHVKIQFDYAANTVTVSTSCSAATNRTSTYTADLAEGTSQISKLTFFSDHQAYSARRCYLDNVKIYTTAEKATDRYKMTNAGVDRAEDSSVATSFTYEAALSGTVTGFEVTSNEKTLDYKWDKEVSVSGGMEVVLGLIVEDLDDENATAKVLIK